MFRIDPVFLEYGWASIDSTFHIAYWYLLLALFTFFVTYFLYLCIFCAAYLYLCIFFAAYFISVHFLCSFFYIFCLPMPRTDDFLAIPRIFATFTTAGALLQTARPSVDPRACARSEHRPVQQHRARPDYARVGRGAQDGRGVAVSEGGCWKIRLDWHLMRVMG